MRLIPLHEWMQVMIPAACRLAPWPSSYAMTGRLLRRPSLPTRGPTFDRKNVVQLRMCTASAEPGDGRPLRVCFDWGRKRIFWELFHVSLEIWRGLNLASCLHSAVSHFGAAKLYLECSVKFPKNMGSLSIEAYKKIPPSRVSAGDPELPYLLSLFPPQQPPRGRPMGCALPHGLTLHPQARATLLSFPAPHPHWWRTLVPQLPWAALPSAFNRAKSFP